MAFFNACRGPRGLRRSPVFVRHQPRTPWAGRSAGLAALACALAVLAPPAAAQREAIVGLPGFPPSHLDAGGNLVEGWGTVRVVLQGEGIPAERQTRVATVLLDGVIPGARAEADRGPVGLTVTAFRGPAWPAGIDVLTIGLQERAGRPATASVLLDLGERAEVGASGVSVGGRLVLALPQNPQPVREERDWGCTGEATAMPGWARPQGECDPAFRNIRAGMGGVPILYRFAIEQKGAARVVLGFCESYWSEAGQRPLLCKVEGAPGQEIDPIARWGRHQPGALLFHASDENGDGRLDVAVLPHPAASDQNPILNAIWIFPPGGPLNLREVVAGRMNAAAIRRVDVGGEEDQTLYVPGKLEYRLALPARGSDRLTFLVACPGGSVPLGERTAWSEASLRQAAARVWRDRFAEGAHISLPDPEAMERFRLALARLALFQHQADGYFLPLARPGGPDAYDPRVLQERAGALDLAGMSAEAERCLRVCWDAPLPPPYAGLGPNQNGVWPGDALAQAHICLALGRHALLSASEGWAERVLPVARARAEALVAARPSGAGAALAAAALRACAALAPAQPPAGKGRPAQGVTREWFLERARQVGATEQAEAEPEDPDARAVWIVCTALARDEGETLALLPGVREEWLQGEGLVAERLPTRFGRVSLRARASAAALTAEVGVPALPAGAQVVLRPPTLAGRTPRSASVDGATVSVVDGRVPIGAGQHRVVVHY